MKLKGYNMKQAGTGYTKANILVEIEEQNKFIGYIPSNGEYIIATNDKRGGYCWTKYFSDLKSLLNHLSDQKELFNDVLDYIERKGA